MDHATIERRDITDRYLLGQQSKVEREAFEEHYFACPLSGTGRSPGSAIAGVGKRRCESVEIFTAR